MYYHLVLLSFFFFNDTATTEIYTLSLHDALPIYVFAAALFTLGLSAWQVTSSIFVGCCIIFAGCCMSGFMGRDTGLPFAAVSRISWGVFGANVPALIRAIAAILWYGIQTYLAAAAVNAIFLRFIPKIGIAPCR